ncbi:hypothetical protein AXF42_Ash014199 [Apostasia shenzhenica]|uniref:BHLH domain-containing protein n=1 Tax=Apostasia shenzhenica TaxID=1088818 RepID=A0A2I0A179_9ASPA|nr:hypothetical protein AXF42_Ash014199 [Apostasia shenzhenica]
MMKSGEGKIMDRKTVEKNRRMHMKSLCFKLASLIPKQEYIYKDSISQQDHLDVAAAYIKKLKERIVSLKQQKMLSGGHGGSAAAAGTAQDPADSRGGKLGFHLPMIDVRHRDPNLEVLLIISSSEASFSFHRVIGVLEEEGAEVVNASFSAVGDKIFYTVHSQAISSRIGLEASQVTERLKQLIRI